jgi:hypothetical protein
VRSKRPYKACAAEQRDELSPFHTQTIARRVPRGALLLAQSRPWSREPVRSACGLGCVKTRRRSIAIEEVYSSKTVLAVNTQADSTLSAN